MTSKDNQPKQAEELHRRAEKIARDKASLSPESCEAQSPEAVRQTLHELRVHQIELELQNEELRRAQSELEASRARYLDLYDLAPVGYCTVSEKGLILEANLTAATLLGVTLGDLVKQAISRFILLEDQDIYYQHRKQLFEGGEPQVCELRMVKSDGTLFWAHLTATAAQHGKGSPMCRVVIRNITKRKQAEAALRESEERYRVAIEASNDGVCIVQNDVHIYVNQAFLNMFRHTSLDDVVGRQMNHFHVHPDDHERIVGYSQARQKGEYAPARYDFKGIRKDGTPIDVDVSVNTIVYKGEKAILAYFRDNTERKRTVEALRESEEKHRILLEESPDSIFSFTPDGHYTYVNPAFAEGVGKPVDDIIGKRIWDVFPKEEADKRFAFLSQVFHTGQEKVIEVRVPRADGDRYYLTTITPIKNAAGQAVSAICSAKNITERKLAEEALQASQQIIEGIINAIPVRVFWKDKNLVYLGCNAAFARDAGFADSKDLIGKDDYKMAWRDQAELYRGDDHQVIESGCAKLLIEGPLTTSEGNTITVLTSKIPLRNSKGEISGVLGTYMDITERKRTEDALLNSENKLRATLDATPFPIAVVDLKDDKIIFWSRSALTLFGHTAPTASEWYQIAYPDPNYRNKVIERWKPFLEIARESGQPVNTGEYQVTCRDGSIRLCELYATFLPDNLIVSFNDITEQKKMQEQFNQAQKMESVGRLAGGVAHDFNNMLGIILGHAELALNRIDPALPLFADLQEIRKAAQRSADLTRQLLAFARKQTIAPKVLDLNETVESMLKMLRRLIGEDIDLAWLPGKNLWLVKVDPSQIDQILANLCVNARDAIAGVGKVTIETKDSTFDAAYCAEHAGFVPGDYVRLTVSDDGCGMDKETIANIFEPFFTTKGVGEGTGLGLSTVYGIVKQNNGFISIYSEPGKGTSFKIYLPRHAGLAVEGRKAEAAEIPKSRGETVLVVEDEQAILYMATRMLEVLGYTVLSANTPAEAIRLAEEHAGDIHLLMTDVVMPEMNGRDLAQNLLSRYPRLKSLFMSGYTADVIAHHGVLDEGVSFIQKPFSLKDLAAKVRQALDR